MTYTVIVTREGDQWLADVSDVHAAHTASDTGLGDLDAYVREVTALVLDLPDEAMAALEFVWEFEVSHADMTKGLGKGWTMAQVAALLNVPEERVVHVPPLAHAAQ